MPVIGGRRAGRAARVRAGTAACPVPPPYTADARALRSATLGCSFPRSPLPDTCSGRSPVRLSSIRETGVRAVLPLRRLRSRSRGRPGRGALAASDREAHRPHDSPPWIVCAFVPAPTHLPDAYQLHASHGLRPSRFGGAPARRANERTSPSGPSLQFTLGPKRPSAAGHSCNYARHLAFKELLVRWRPLDTLARSKHLARDGVESDPFGREQSQLLRVMESALAVAGGAPLAVEHAMDGG